MDKFTFIYADQTEKRVTGEVEANDAAHAAVKIMGERGDGQKPRYARHTPAVKEERLMLAGNAELVAFLRPDVLFLELKKAGSRKRKELEFTA